MQGREGLEELPEAVIGPFGTWLDLVLYLLAWLCWDLLEYPPTFFPSLGLWRIRLYHSLVETGFMGTFSLLFSAMLIAN